MTTPLVSVIIPCYNLGEYLAEAVESVLAQTRQDFEILIVDDGSTDETTRTVLETAAWPHTTIFRTPNRGLAQARNYLIERARGTHLCALDADDRLAPAFLERTLGAFEQDPGLTFVSTHLQMFGDEHRQWPDDDRCTFPMLLCDDTVITAALVKKDAVTGVGGYDAKMPGQGDEDWDLWISLVENGYRGLILPEVLFHYRRRRGSMCDQCTSGPLHINLTRYLIRKHAASYRAHLLDVLLWKEARIADIRRANIRVETHIGSYLEPWLATRRAELAALKLKLQAARVQDLERRTAARTGEVEQELERIRAQYGALHAEYESAMGEIAALRESTIWQMTSPLRALYELGRRGGGDPP
jgi:glycosyltransferase involved in cell wall biosynthesis